MTSESSQLDQHKSVLEAYGPALQSALFLDTQGRIQEFLPSLASLVHLSPSSLKSLHWLLLFDPASTEELGDAYSEMFRCGRSQCRARLSGSPMTLARGEDTEFTLFLSKCFNSQREFSGFLIFIL
jgi:hypothetical protein